MKSIILAAGYATRMYPLTKDFPKPLLQVGAFSILDRLIRDVDAIDVDCGFNTF
jgi:glucose-1-phosphate thymidylyltransferase